MSTLLEVWSSTTLTSLVYMTYSLYSVADYESMTLGRTPLNCIDAMNIYSYSKYQTFFAEEAGDLLSTQARMDAGSWISAPSAGGSVAPSNAAWEHQ